jgi:hypothetical protein
MPTLPEWGPLLVRTDFSDHDAWQAVRDEAVGESDEGFSAGVEPVSDPDWDGAGWEAVKAAAPVGDYGPNVLFIADAITCASPEHPILVVDLLSPEEYPEAAGRTPFRCIASRLWSVENNLSLANMDWEEFADAVDADGVFRGFSRP